jgi:pyruvate dehydrogenase E1 component
LASSTLGRPLADLYRHYSIDPNAIVAAAQSIAPGRPIRYLRALS